MLDAARPPVGARQRRRRAAASAPTLQLATLPGLIRVRMKLVLAVAVLACSGCCATATTYYVSSSIGDDTAAGTSPDSPWRSLARAGKGEALRAAGDSLLLRQGDSWIVETGDALVLTNASGTLGSYYHGNNTRATQPLIQVSSRGSWAACVRLYDATELTVTGLRLAGCSAGVLVTQSVLLTKNIAVVNNIFADIRGPMQLFLPAGSSAPAPWVQDWGVAVALATKNTTKNPGACKTVNLTVANNAAVRIDQFYTNAQPGPGWNDGPMPSDLKLTAWGSRAGGRRGRFGFAGTDDKTGTTHRRLQAGAMRMSLTVEGCALRGNTVQGCGYNCVEMGGTTHMTLSDSVFLRDTPPDMFVCVCKILRVYT